MPDIAKPNYQYLWSSGGSLVAPSSVKIQTGWTAEVPPFQWENWSQNRQDQAIAHILQHGVAVWDNATEYQAGKSYVTGGNGKTYIALTTHVNVNPVTDAFEINWADVFKPGVSVITGNTSFTVPSVVKVGLKKAHVTVIGAGGGGGVAAVSNGGAGGGGGGIGEGLIDLTGVSSVSVTIGSGGASGLGGGTSSFGTHISATGGGGATGGAAPTPGTAGTASGAGVFRANTLGAGLQRVLLAGGRIINGKGGGDGGGSQIETDVSAIVGANAIADGCGGSGGLNGAAGGVGANGVVIVRW